MSNPYTFAPANPSAGMYSRGKPPGVWYAYIAYCLFLAFVYLVFIVLGLVLILYAEPLAEADREVNEPFAFAAIGGLVAVVCLPFMILSLLGPLLPKNKVGWIYGIVLLAFGLTSGCTLIFAGIVLAFWLQRPTRAFFGMST